MLRLAVAVIVVIALAAAAPALAVPTLAVDTTAPGAHAIDPGAHVAVWVSVGRAARSSRH